MENNLPNRKSLRLQHFDYNTSAMYYITICTKDRKCILSNIDEPVGDGALDVPKTRLTRIGKIIEKNLLSSEKISGVKIDQYVIMPDHIHAIIFLLPNEHTNNPKELLMSTHQGTSRAPSPTNKILPHIISTFKRFCNKEIGDNIFQRGYYDHIIKNREDYDALRKYIYENPIRWYYKKLYPEE